LLRAQSQSRRTPLPAAGLVDFIRPAGWGGARPGHRDLPTGIPSLGLLFDFGNDSSSQHAFVDFVSRRILLPHKDFSFSYPTKECDSLTSMSDFSHQRKDFSALVLSPVIFRLASTFCLMSV
jgi:hypothetical protein